MKNETPVQSFGSGGVMSREQVWKVIGLTLLFCALQFSSAQGVTFITFDAPGTVPGSGYTQPQAINPAGVVTGFFTDSSGINEGFVRALDGTITPFNLGTDTEPQAINPAGTIVGFYSGQLAGQSGRFGFVRAPNGNVTPLNFGNVNNTQAFGINPAGAITGTYASGSTFLGFILRSGATLPIPFDNIPSQFPPVTISAGSGINPAGAITGYYIDQFGTHCFLRTPAGSFVTFDPQGSGVFTRVNQPLAINPSGAITGYYQDVNVNTHGFLRARSGTLTTIDTPAFLNPANPSLTFALAINPAGTIVGYYVDTSFIQHGFFLPSGGIFTPFDVPSQNPPVIVTVAVAINPTGVITGYYADSSGTHGFIRLP